LETVPVKPFIEAVQDANPRVQAAAIIALGRLGKKEAAEALLEIQVPKSTNIPETGKEGPHATPNSEIVLPHLAVRSLVALNAVDETIDALNDNPKLALWTLRYMHDTKAVNGLIAAYKDSDSKDEVLSTLARLYNKEAPYDGSWWWSTRPDTHGPYYKGITWEGSDAIKAFLTKQMEADGESKADFYARLNDRNRLGITELGTAVVEETEEIGNKVDFKAIKNRKGQVGEASIEDVILAMGEIKGDASKGKALFTSQGCVACHSVEKGQVMKGPFMGQIGSIMNRDQIVESILKPNASISQGFATFMIETKVGDSYMGFITAESADVLTIRDIAGNATKLAKGDIKSRKEMENSMMPAGLANSLSYEELASLVTYLQGKK
jgi:putative heme-binding domain-containing protein